MNTKNCQLQLIASVHPGLEFNVGMHRSVRSWIHLAHREKKVYIYSMEVLLFFIMELDFRKQAGALALLLLQLTPQGSLVLCGKKPNSVSYTMVTAV